MKKESSGGQFKGKITSGIKPAQTVESTLAFVYQQLPAWRDDTSRPAEHSENQLNLQLCKFLDCQARNLFPMVRFDHEEYQHGRRSVDLSASPVQPTRINAQLFCIYTPFLVFECKRLPAPSKDREQEYVTGGTKQSGGIQRFKLGLHGATLDQAAIIGYIQQNTPKHWHTKINQWIDKLSQCQSTDPCDWKQNDKLGSLTTDAIQMTARCKSIHERTGQSINSMKVSIHHFWIMMPPIDSGV